MQRTGSMLYTTFAVLVLDVCLQVFSFLRYGILGFSRFCRSDFSKREEVALSMIVTPTSCISPTDPSNSCVKAVKQQQGDPDIFVIVI